MTSGGYIATPALGLVLVKISFLISMLFTKSDDSIPISENFCWTGEWCGHKSETHYLDNTALHSGERSCVCDDGPKD